MRDNDDKKYSDDKNIPDQNDELSDINGMTDNYEQDNIDSVEVDSSKKTIKHSMDISRRQQSKSSILFMLQSNSRFMLSTIPLGFIAILVFSILTQTVLLYASNYQNSTYKEQIVKLDDDYTNNMDKVNDKYTEERIRGILTINDIYIYTNSLWEYKFTANDKNILEDKITVDAIGSKLTIVFTEKRKVNPLPKSLINIGSVTRGDTEDSIDRHISISDSRATKKLTTNDDSNVLEYVVTGVKSGDKINIEVSDQLGAKINNPFSRIAVTIK
jgi:hypothetical protein